MCASSSFRRSSLPLLLALAGCLAGCQLTAIDLELAPDPDLSDVASLAKEMEQLKITLHGTEESAARDLYPGRQAGPDPGSGTFIEDVDGDGAKELWAVVAKPAPEELPLIRVERGSLPLDPVRMAIWRGSGPIRARTRPSSWRSSLNSSSVTYPPHS